MSLYFTPNEVVWRFPEYDVHYAYPSRETHLRMKINLVSEFPIRYVVNKCFSIDNAQVVPFAKVRQLIFIQRVPFLECHWGS